MSPHSIPLINKTQLVWLWHHVLLALYGFRSGQRQKIYEIRESRAVSVTVQLELFPHLDCKTGKTDKRESIFYVVREKSGDFDQTGKVGKFYPKYWKIRIF